MMLASIIHLFHSEIQLTSLLCVWGYEEDGLTEGITRKFQSLFIIIIIFFFFEKPDCKEISIFINYIRLTNHQSAPFHLNGTVPY